MCTLSVVDSCTQTIIKWQFIISIQNYVYSLVGRVLDNIVGFLIVEKSKNLFLKIVKDDWFKESSWEFRGL